ncbi:MAG: hypothetical protein RMK29_22080 [Myxococcales bacterium]|nr:hypothetical protein [Myxococcota bacterium]MDW8284404.1 hypothetical protein [Myxococcales bacterium]
MRPDILSDRCRLLLLPALSRGNSPGGRGALMHMATQVGVSRDRIWKIWRGLVAPTPEEVERVARTAAGLLGCPEQDLQRFVATGDRQVMAWLRERVPLPPRCAHCGTPPGPHSPLLRPWGVHEACLPSLRDGAQARWMAEVEDRIEEAPRLLLRVWRAEREEQQVVTLYSLSTRAGMDYRCFVRAWVLSRLPRRRVPRSRPEPMSRRVRLAWTLEVERHLPQAPEAIRLLWRRAREEGVRLNLERLADFAHMPHWQFRKRWVEAGLPTPRQTAAMLAAATQQEATSPEP